MLPYNIYTYNLTGFVHIFAKNINLSHFEKVKGLRVVILL
jgi:hypothetical protein